MKFGFDVEVNGPHQLGIEWQWENIDGVVCTGPAGAEPPRIVVTITQLDPCADVIAKGTGA